AQRRHDERRHAVAGDDPQRDLGLAGAGGLDDDATPAGLLPGRDGGILIGPERRESGPERRAVEEALRVVVEREAVLGGVLPEARMVQRLGGPRPYALVPGQIARGLRRGRGRQPVRYTVSLECGDSAW